MYSYQYILLPPDELLLFYTYMESFPDMSYNTIIFFGMFLFDKIDGPILLFA